MDPNGFEVADKCENGPSRGRRSGFAPDGSPYNQLINGHQYLFQDMWSNAASGCVQSSNATGSPLPLHTVSLRQFSPLVSGSLGVARRLPVQREPAARLDTWSRGATRARAPTAAGGRSSCARRSGAPHAVGDDRDGDRRRLRGRPTSTRRPDRHRRRRQPVHRGRLHRLVRSRPRLRGRTHAASCSAPCGADRRAVAAGRLQAHRAPGAAVQHRGRRGADPDAAARSRDAADDEQRGQPRRVAARAQWRARQAHRVARRAPQRVRAAQRPAAVPPTRLPAVHRAAADRVGPLHGPRAGRPLPARPPLARAPAASAAVFVRGLHLARRPGADPDRTPPGAG